jgi:hypothetical protein
MEQPRRQFSGILADPPRGSGDHGEFAKLVVTMRITGQISKAAIAGQSDKYRRFAEQCRELAKPLSNDFKETLLKMAKDWDDLARGETSGMSRTKKPRLP